MSNMDRMKKMSEDITKIFHEHHEKTKQPKIKVTNPFSGQSAMLTEEENKLYLSIKLAELEERYETMQKQLSKFSRLNPKAYMTLLDQQPQVVAPLRGAAYL